MADREKVVKGLKTCTERSVCCGCGYYKPYAPRTLNSPLCYKIMMKDALELLEEKEPLIIKKDNVDEVYDYMAECPECGMIWAMWYSERMRYCPGCGRKVKWDA